MRSSLLVCALALTVLAGCPRVAMRDAGTDDAGRADTGPALDAPVTLDVPVAFDVPSALDAPIARDVPVDVRDVPTRVDAPTPIDTGIDTGEVGVDAGRDGGPDAPMPDAGVDAPVTSLGAGLVLLLELDESGRGTAPLGADFFDATGRGNHGTAGGGGITFAAAGVRGGAVELDGTSGFVSVPDSASLRPAEVSIAAWFSLRRAPGSTGLTLIARPQSGPPWSHPFLSWMIRINTLSQIEASVGGTTGYSGPFTVPTLSVGTWHHVVLSYDGTTARLHLDGTLIGGNALGGAIAYTGLPLIIGADYGAAPLDDYFPGSVDQVAIWNRVLSDAEVVRLYAGGAGVALP